MAMNSPIGIMRRLWASRRVRIILSATLIGLSCGLINLGLPLEDVLYSMRTSLRHEVASDDIIVVKIDDRTLNELGAADVPRDMDALLIDKLLAAGAKQIVFDRAYDFLEDPSKDRILANTLKAHPGKVFMGAAYQVNNDGQEELTLLPASLFRGHVGIVSGVGYVHPFKLNTTFPFKADGEKGPIPSMSAELAGIKHLPDGAFQPDYAIDYKSIPSVSYIDVIRDRVSPRMFRGRDIMVAPTSLIAHDYHPMPSQGYVAGGYFQVIAALTLKRGIPVQLGWLPAFLVVLLLIVTGIGRGQPVDRYRIAGVIAIIVFVPFILDAHGVHMDVFPAAITAGIAIFRARALDREEMASNTNAGSGLPSLQALRELKQVPPGILIALKVRNYGAITGSFAQPVEARLAAEIVRRIRIGDPDCLIYHEGDMFHWITPISNPLDVVENLEGLHQIMQNGMRIEDRDVDLSFNCGIDSDDERPITSRVSNARQAAEEAVRQDELVCHYDAGSREVQWEISLLSSLDRAIDNGDVWVAYQPKLDLRSGGIKGAEALVRWTHPERGPIAPDDFIGLAEEYHRIEKITRFVLDEAIRTAAALRHESPDFSVSVNISAQLLRNPGLPEMIFGALDAHDLPPEALTLEITETDRLDRSSRTFDMMRLLVASGLEISIDDFGTGNATIDYLRYLPATEVKIDKLFIKGMEHSRADLLLVQSIIDMAHTLDRRVVAEGVESEEIVERLRSMKCDLVQGFQVSKPVPAADLLAILGRSQQTSNG